MFSRSVTANVYLIYSSHSIIFCNNRLEVATKQQAIKNLEIISDNNIQPENVSFVDLSIERSSIKIKTNKRIKIMRVDKSCDGISYEIKTLNAIKVLDRTLNEYNSHEIFLSFNGGKDCTVLLHMFASLFVTKYPNEKLLCLYIQPESPFDEIEQFIHECEQNYPIAVEIIRGTVKGALYEICNKYPNLKACVMGCRRTDPYCTDLNEFQNTDPGWPSLMRINPLLEWTCKDIWDYLNQLNVPYCSLYRRGYTSVGDRTNTKPNPFLRQTNAITGKEEYLHADQLINQDENERAGRF